MSEANKGPLVLTLCWVGQALAITVVGLRLWTRLFVKFSPGLDDLAIFISLAVMIGATAAVTRQVDPFGFGRHFYDLSLEEKTGVLKFLTFAEFLSFISLFFLRLSVSIFLFRLLGRIRYWTRTLLFFIGALNFCSVMIICIIYGTQCKPFSGAWHKEMNAKCYSQEMLTAALRFYGGISVSIDVMCAVIPIIIIKDLQMNKKTKIALCVIVGLGFVPGGCAIGKTVTGNHPTDDPSYVWVATELWAAWESYTGLIVASLPALHQLFTLVRAKTSQRTSTYVYRDLKSEEPMPLKHLPRVGSRQTMLHTSSSSHNDSSPGPESNAEQAWLATVTNTDQNIRIKKRTDMSVNLEPNTHAMEKTWRASNGKSSNEKNGTQKRPQDDVSLVDALNSNPQTLQQPSSVITRDNGRGEVDLEGQVNDVSRDSRAKAHNTLGLS